MAEKKTASKFLETKYFGLVIGFLVFLLLFALSRGTVLIRIIEQKMLDLNFRLKNSVTRTRVQEGVSVVQANPRISPDILIVGIDDKSLARFGRWPFPRYRHADLMDSFSRIKNQSERERALFIDVFFIEPSDTPEDDALLVSSIKSNGRVFLETVLTPEENPPRPTRSSSAGRTYWISASARSRTSKATGCKSAPSSAFSRLSSPIAGPRTGTDTRISFPMRDQVYRRQPLVARLSASGKRDPARPAHRERAGGQGRTSSTWPGSTRTTSTHEIPYPLTPEVLEDLKAQMAKSAPLKVVEATDTSPAKIYFVVRKYRDTFLPSITLALALEYMHKKMSDVEVVLGQYIRIPAPREIQRGHPAVGAVHADGHAAHLRQGRKRHETGNIQEVSRSPHPHRRQRDPCSSISWASPPAPIPTSTRLSPCAPIRATRQTPPAPDPARWPATKKVGNTILMVGPFSQGIASDQKPTPFGLMYGVEMHANALNTILMGNFLYYAAPWVNTLILFALSCSSPSWCRGCPRSGPSSSRSARSLCTFLSSCFMFEFGNYIVTFSAPAIGVFLTSSPWWRTGPSSRKMTSGASATCSAST